MAQDQTVVDHLLLGRQALLDDVDQAHAEVERLQAEVNRLTAAIDQLDSVIGMVGSGATPPPAARTTSQPRAETPAAAAPQRPARSSAPAKRSAPRARKQSGQAPKSIRVHVLEMLAAESRDWSLAEIIDRIHDAGIQAHDDAVRSITIKLMKDGRVERVGRGQYRLAGKGSNRSASTPPPAQTSGTDTEPAPEPETVETEETAETAETAGNVETVETVETDTATPPADEVPAPQDETVSDEQPASGEERSGSSDPDRPYTPPLNLGQPWG